jgi:hypothetical protein
MNKTKKYFEIIKKIKVNQNYKLFHYRNKLFKTKQIENKEEVDIGYKAVVSALKGNIFITSM